MKQDTPHNAQNYIKETRNALGLEVTEFANLLGMNKTGERTMGEWENGET